MARMARQRRSIPKERNMQLTDFAGLREVVIAHHALLRSKQMAGEAQADDDDRSLHSYFAG